VDPVVLTYNWSLFEVTPNERTLRIAYESGGTPPTRAEVEETDDQITVRLVHEVVPPLQPDGSRRLISAGVSVVSCVAVALAEPLGGRRIFAYVADPRTGEVTRRPARRSDHPLSMPCQCTPRRETTFEFLAQL
jgi:hypothetical protein